MNTICNINEGEQLLGGFRSQFGLVWKSDHERSVHPLASLTGQLDQFFNAYSQRCHVCTHELLINHDIKKVPMGRKRNWNFLNSSCTEVYRCHYTWKFKWINEKDFMFETKRSHFINRQYWWTSNKYLFVVDLWEVHNQKLFEEVNIWTSQHYNKQAGKPKATITKDFVKYQLNVTNLIADWV